MDNENPQVAHPGGAGPAPQSYPASSYPGAPAVPSYPGAPAVPSHPGPPAAPPYPGPPGGRPYGTPPPSPKTNIFAILSLVLGIIGGIGLAVIFGIIALVQIKRRGERGRGLAIAGIVLGATWLIVIGAVVAIAIASGPIRDGSGAITEKGTESVTDLQVGDCVNGVTEGSPILSLPVVPCAQSHQGEIFAEFNLPAGQWPGEQAVAKQSEAGCEARLAAYAPAAAKDPRTEYFALRPLENSWAKDRSVTCIATNSAGPQTGSLRD